MNRGLVLSGILAVTIAISAWCVVRSATAKTVLETVVLFLQATVFAWLAIITIAILSKIP